MTKMQTRMILILFSVLFPVVFFQNCATNSDSPKTASPAAKTCFEQLGTNSEWSTPTEVPLDGYTANAMEPKFAADMVVLFWNDKPATDTQMNIHYAVKQGNGRYQYVGTLTGTVDNAALDGVPAIDSSGNFYFVSLRSYSTNSQTIFSGQVQVTGPGTMQIINVAAADTAITRNTPGKIDMDIDVSWDGTLMIAARTMFSGKPYPDESWLDLFTVSSRVAAPLAGSADLLKNVNLPECRIYAPNLSNDLKELYYTVLPATENVGDSDFRIAVAKRNSTTEPFGAGQIIQSISTSSAPFIVEGPAISVDGKTMMFHKYDVASSRFKIYQVTRP